MHSHYHVRLGSRWQLTAETQLQHIKQTMIPINVLTSPGGRQACPHLALLNVSCHLNSSIQPFSHTSAKLPLSFLAQGQAVCLHLVLCALGYFLGCTSGPILMLGSEDLMCATWNTCFLGSILTGPGRMTGWRKCLLCSF